MCQALFLGHYLHELTLTVSHEIGTVILTILQVKKLRQRVSNLSKDLELCKLDILIQPI